jgi:hypothetical protein
MPGFWGYIKNEKFAVGCGGRTVFVYDDCGNELARFKDMNFAYTPMFCPEHNLFVVKSAEGRLAVYSLDTMKLIKKFRFSKINCSQDDTFCFSKDGRYFYNIERHIQEFYPCLSVYETQGFTRIKQLFMPTEATDSEGNKKIIRSQPEIEHIEHDDVHDGLFVMGRNDTKNGLAYFVANLDGDSLINVIKIPPEKYCYILGYKHLELLGFTEKAKQWSTLSYSGCDMENLEHIKLSDFISAL